VKNGPYCVHKCPVVKYSDDNGICQDCHENCQSYGCTGPLNSVGDGACNACNIAVYDHDKEVTMCLPADSDCESGYFKYLNLPSTYGQMTGKQVRCCAFVWPVNQEMKSQMKIASTVRPSTPVDMNAIFLQLYEWL